MDLIMQFIDIVLHLDVYLDTVIRQYGFWTYLILFLIIFSETGFVVTPFLPGDSLLFAAGTLAGIGSLHVGYLFTLLSIAAVAGNIVNYQIGYFMGPRVFRKESGLFFKREYLDRTNRFYARYGAITIVIARFLPIIRTFAPFVAGIGRMAYWRFSLYNVVGSIAWTTVFVIGGYYFGNIPVVKQNFTLVILAIIILSVLPSIIGFLKARK
jgi:membrane-associated protein